MKRSRRSPSGRRRRAFAAALVIGLAAALDGCGVLPEDEAFAREYAKARDADFRAAVHREFQALLRDWADAVATDDVDAVMALYSPDAWIRLDYPARGADVRPATEQWVRGTRNVLLGAADFDFSGDLAVGTVRLLVTPTDGARRAGVMVVVIRSTDAGWRIRSQVLGLPSEP